MPRADLPVTQITRTGVVTTAETAGDATNKHSVVNDGRVFIIVRNAGAGARVLTVQLSGTVDGQAATARTYSIAAAAEKYIGPWPTSYYGTSLLLDPEHAELKLSAYRL